jgi:SAM-dependent methyltransferase
MKKIIARTIKSIFSHLGLVIAPAEDKFKLEVYREHYSSDLERKPFYNIGSGSFFHPYWTNIDYISDWYKSTQTNVIHHNLMSLEPLPIETEDAKVIYTSHTIEHIKEDAVCKLFNEVYRCLESGGIFRITTPDAEMGYRALMNGDEDWFYWDRHYITKSIYKRLYHKPATSVPLSERWLHHIASQLAPNSISPSEHKFSDKEIWSAIDKFGFPDVLDYFCNLCLFRSERPGNHISWWTHEKTIRFLKEAGFTIIYRSGFGQSSCPLLRNTSLFDNTYPQMSLYIEAVKE